MASLIVIDAASDLVEKKDNLVFRGLGLKVGLDSAQHHGTEGILIDLGQDGVGILIVVVHVGSSKTEH